YFHYPRGSNNDHSAIPLAVDPTNGKLDNATCVICKPMHWVENNTLLMIEAGVQRLSFDLTNDEVTENTSKVPLPQEKPPSQGVVVDRAPFERSHHVEFYVTCVFLTEKRAIVFPREGSFNQFHDYIRQRFGLQCNSFFYKNKVNDMITLKDEEDWKIAKWEVEMEGTVRLDVYME
ncbi:10547_t:CDS:2, partial [Acaulospora morrowiae]